MNRPRSTAVTEGDQRAPARAFFRAMERAALRPWRAAPAWLRYGAAMGLAGASLPARLIGVRPPDVAAVDPRDGRFRSPAWNDNALFARSSPMVQRNPPGSSSSTGGPPSGGLGRAHRQKCRNAAVHAASEPAPLPGRAWAGSPRPGGGR